MTTQGEGSRSHRDPSPLGHEQHLDAWVAGWDACLDWLWPRIQRLESDADRLYLAAFNPKERAELIQRRLDQHFRDEWDNFPRRTDPEEVA